MSPQDFINLIGPAAKLSARSTGIPASFTVAEAALESGWGSSLLAQKGKNLFGIKADSSWTGEILSLNTREFLKGSWTIVPARWRRYKSWQQCMEDHGAFFHENARYSKCLKCTSGIDFSIAAAQAGYATDPNYAKKLISIIKQYQLFNLEGGA